MFYILCHIGFAGVFISTFFCKSYGDLQGVIAAMTIIYALVAGENSFQAKEKEKKDKKIADKMTEIKEELSTLQAQNSDLRKQILDYKEKEKQNIIFYDVSPE